MSHRDSKVDNLLILAIASICVGENATLFVIRCADGRYSGGLALTVAVCLTIALVVGGRAFARLLD